jgi:pimeloyl-ACP methyl ester carboxylesterase
VVRSPLRRQNNTGVWADSCPLTAWLDVETHVIAGEEHRVITPEWVQYAAPRVDADLLIIPGGHSPYLARLDVGAHTLDTLLVTHEDVRPRREHR